MTANAPLLVVALDAGDPERILKGTRTGELPVLASLVERGAVARLFGPESVSVHGTWATLFSGLSLAEHGGYARRSLRPGRYALEPAPLHEATPFWADLDGAEILTVDAPEIDPIPHLAGRQLAHWGDHPTSRPAIAVPPDLVEHARRLVGPRIASDERQRGGRRRDRRVRSALLRRIERKGRLVRALLAERAARVVVVGFGDTHAAGHRFGKYETNGDPLAGALREVYAAIDREIGRTIEAFAEAPNVFVLADSGIREGQPLGATMDDLCRALGYKASRGPTLGARLRGRLTPLLSVRARTALREARFLGGTDWSRTTAFAIPSSYTGYLRVNLAGREPQGIVAPGAEYEALLDRLTADLELLVDAATREPVVESITRTTSAFGGGPPARLPDLFVDFRPCALPQRIEHPRATIVRRRAGDLRDNNHSRRGLAIAAGPAVARRGDVGDVPPSAIAPVFRAVLGEAPAPAALGAGVAAFLA